MHTHRCLGKSALLLTTLAAATTSRAVQFGQFDTFTDGTTQGWGDGQGNGTNVPDGGPGGAGDAFYYHDSGFIVSKQVFFNRSASWIGDYVAAHVSRVEFDVANFSDDLGSAEPLQLRVAGFVQDQSSGFAREAYSTTNAIEIPADKVWRHVGFDLSSASMTNVIGTFTYGQLFSNIGQLRILSSAFPNYQGDDVLSRLAIDNVRATGLPGDANFSNTVDAADFTVLANHFNQSGQGWGQGDFNFDGKVNTLDFNALASNYGTSVGGAASLGSVVPEPASVFLLGCVLMRAMQMHRRITRA